MAEFEDLKGKTLVSVKRVDAGGWDGEQIIFEVEGGDCYVMGHSQNCCEIVSVQDIEGDLDTLVGSEILIAESSSNMETTDDSQDEWTFFKIATIRGHVDIRWHGESNGYYSTDVHIEFVSAAERASTTN